jgi:hypothetical protein
MSWYNLCTAGVSRCYLQTLRLCQIAVSVPTSVLPNRLLHNNQAPTAPTTASAPDPAFAAIPVAVAAEAAALVALAPVPLVVAAEAEAAAAAGRVEGCATPLGQCQWSPWGSQVEAVAAWSWSWSSSSSCECEDVMADAADPVFDARAGGVVGSGTPAGQCLWCVNDGMVW